MGNILGGQLFSSRYHYQWRKQAWCQRHVLLQIFRSYSDKNATKNATKNAMQCKYAGLTYISDVITESGFDISKVDRSTLCNNLQIFNSPIILKYNWRREIEINENTLNEWQSMDQSAGNTGKSAGNTGEKHPTIRQNATINTYCITMPQSHLTQANAMHSHLKFTMYDTLKKEVVQHKA